MAMLSTGVSFVFSNSVTGLNTLVGVPEGWLYENKLKEGSPIMPDMAENGGESLDSGDR